jgi:hypothetical protein
MTPFLQSFARCPFELQLKHLAKKLVMDEQKSDQKKNLNLIGMNSYHKKVHKALHKTAPSKKNKEEGSLKEAGSLKEDNLNDGHVVEIRIVNYNIA